ncbi:MAG: hypothetical protein B1H13_15040 [Desulfobacteraceae bacterium 4484_190.3]|nr:MAG: hypothetical protein B1H13_15040 [Desulfobacteraceae bacterium 4484_190.3]
MKKAPCIAVFGTGSEVGKSIVATALCRFFANRGVCVAPFKAQNMSNEGLEMGRAQIVQAEAAGIPPHVDMNPILLKPASEIGSQVVLLGNAVFNSTASDYQKRKENLFSKACDALDRLRRKYRLIIMEGAGSCAEINLMQTDIVNFRMAEYAGADVILVADIHKGGVFGQIVGTLECISKTQQDLIKGFIINRFRGDKNLFKDGVRWIEEKTGKKVFGVLPWYTDFNIEAEDSVVIEKCGKVSSKKTGQGGHILGICGGYQMMGRLVHDPEGLEGKPGTTRGLSLLPVETILNAPKTTTLTRFSVNGIKGAGYEIHMGRTKRLGGRPMFYVQQRNNIIDEDEDGCVALNNRIMGSYIHGLFDTPAIAKYWLDSIGLGSIQVHQAHGPAARDKAYDLLSAHFEKHVDTEEILEMSAI